MMISTPDQAVATRLNLPRDNNHRLLLISDNDKQVIFSYTQKSTTMDCHIAANRGGKLIIRDAVKLFCNVIFNQYQSINQIAGVVQKTSVKNLLLNVGFSSLCQAVINDKLVDILAINRGQHGICN